MAPSFYLLNNNKERNNMVYANKDSGQAIGEILAVLADKYRLSGVEIKLSQDALVTSVTISSPVSLKNDKSKDKKRNGGPNSAVIYDGITTKEWAKKLRVARNTISYRIRKHGNPYGTKVPTDSDKIIAGS